MKRTTYILIGTYLAGMIFIIISIVVVRNTIVVKNPQVYTLEMPKEKTEIELANIQNIKFLGTYPTNSSYIGMGAIGIKPAADGNTGKLAIPTMKGLTAKVNGNTLIVNFDWDTATSKEEVEKAHQLRLEAIDFVLELPNGSYCIENNLYSNLNIVGVKADSLNITSRSIVTLDDCTINSLAVKGEHIAFHVSNSTLKNIYTDLDVVNKWSVQNSTVQTHFLTGSGHKKHFVNDLGSSERVVWMPKDKDSKLMITLESATDVIFNKPN
ncbi:hypothetical protein LJC29_03915 [Bacteroides sp. OttesenSCG-928-N06]|nr:hypothetical protein [Bacteroides sp. OttesenSCG-928-N06]